MESAVPYVTNDDLPPSVRNHLPRHGQDIYREAFNHAWQEYADDPRLEEIAHRVACGSATGKIRNYDARAAR
jgi:cation transport regulator